MDVELTERILDLGNGITIGMVMDGESWVGLGAVTAGDVALRDALRPIVLRIQTPEGICYTDYQLVSEDKEDNGRITVTLNAIGFPWGKQIYLDEYQQAQYTVMDQPRKVQDTVLLHFSPVQDTLGEHTLNGFSYSVEFRSDKRLIHQIIVDGSWELGGGTSGNTVLNQGQCNRPVYYGARETLFTTSCLKALDKHGPPPGMSFQMVPRGGVVQCFDFQHNADGALLQYWPQMESISCTQESPLGSDRLHVVDEYHVPLASQVTTTPQHVLYLPQALEAHEGRDLWWEATEKINGALRKTYGVEESIACPDAQKIGYAQTKGDRVVSTIMGEEVEHQDILYALADNYFPALARNGIQEVFMETMSQSDATEMGMVRKLDRGAHGDLHCGSVCCTWRFYPSDFWGGIKAWKYAYDAAQKLGIKVSAWAAPHLSHNAPIFKEHPEWKAIGPDSMNSGGGYGPHAIIALDWNTEIFNWVLDDFRRWKEEGGFDNLFMDSWSNMGLLPLNYAKDMRPNWTRLSKFCGELSALGTTLSFESTSPFGLMAPYFSDLRNDLHEVASAVAGQNDLGWWLGEEDMMFNVKMHGIRPKERTPEAVFEMRFKAMANRGGMMIADLFDKDWNMPECHVLLNRTYQTVVQHMRTRRLLPGGMGTRWQDGVTEVIWAYRDGVVPLAPGAQVERMIGLDHETMACEGALSLQAKQVYRIRNTNNGEKR